MMAVTGTGRHERVRRDGSVSGRARTTAQRARRSPRTRQREGKSAQPGRFGTAEDLLLEVMSPLLYSSSSFRRWEGFGRGVWRAEQRWRRWRQGVKRPLRGFWENTASFQACLPRLLWNWKQVDNSTPAQRRSQSSRLQISPVLAPPWIAFRGQTLNLWFFFFFTYFKVNYQEPASGRLPREMNLKREASQVLQPTDKNKSTAETNSSTHFKEKKKKKNKREKGFKQDLLFLFFFPPISEISVSALNALF